MLLTYNNLAGTTSEEGVIFVYGVFTKPVSAVECTVYTAAIFKQHALRILHKYLPLYKDIDRRDMLAQVKYDFHKGCVPISPFSKCALVHFP
jgi:hypothetical protein